MNPELSLTMDGKISTVLSESFHSILLHMQMVGPSLIDKSLDLDLFHFITYTTPKYLAAAAIPATEIIAMYGAPTLEK